MDGMNPIRIQWVIKGYHIFRLKPDVDQMMILTRDTGNQFDPNAMKVSLPVEGSVWGVGVGAQVCI